MTNYDSSQTTGSGTGKEKKKSFDAKIEKKGNITLDQGVTYSVTVTATNDQGKTSDPQKFEFTMRNDDDPTPQMTTIIAVMVGIIIGNCYTIVQHRVLMFYSSVGCICRYFVLLHETGWFHYDLSAIAEFDLRSQK